MRKNNTLQAEGRYRFMDMHCAYVGIVGCRDQVVLSESLLWLRVDPEAGK